jgi:cellulose synthase/poly-beta-1,6-N-acetylglucosamine synthase-like glycosyltransferase
MFEIAARQRIGFMKSSLLGKHSSLHVARKRSFPSMPRDRNISDLIKNPGLYRSLLENPSKRFWSISIAANALCVGGFLASNYNLVTNALCSGNIVTGVTYAMLMASFCYFSVLCVTMPMITNIGRFFLKQEVTPDIPIDEDLPKVTVQIPCRNEPASVVIENALLSALNLDYPADKLEIQVIDNSDDLSYIELREYCRKFKNVTFIHREGAEGAKAKNLNIGLRRAHGEYILILDSDNRADPDFLKRLVAEVKKDPSLAYVYTFADYWNMDQNIFTKSLANFYAFVMPTLYTQFRFGFSPFNGFGTLLNRKIVEEAGGWNENTVGEDWDLAIRLRLQGYTGKSVSHTIVHDAIPANLTRYRIQQSRWSIGSMQHIKNYIFKFLFDRNISFAEKASLIFYLSFYPSISLLTFAPALFFVPLAILSDADTHNSLGDWFIGAWVGSSIQPVFSYFANRFTKSMSEGIFIGKFKYLFPGVLTSFGMIPEVAKSVVAFLAGKKTAFKVTPKGLQAHAPSLFQSFREYKTELICGSLILGSSMFVSSVSGLYSFLGLGLILSPLISWMGMRKK